MAEAWRECHPKIRRHGGPDMRPNVNARTMLHGQDDGEELHFKPYLNELLRTLALDVSYERGEGDHLYYRGRDGREIEVLDLIGGYGSLLLGHAHPALVAEAQRLLASGRPVHAQGSRRETAVRLAAELARRARGDYCAVFANSGAEAV